MHCFHVASWIIGLIYVSVILGSLVTYLWHAALSIALSLRFHEPDTDAPWLLTGPLMGIMERIFFTCVVALDLSGTAIAMMAWIALKAQSHFNIVNVNPRVDAQNFRRLYRELLASLGSMLMAAIGGYVWKAGLSVWPFSAQI